MAAPGKLFIIILVWGTNILHRRSEAFECQTPNTGGCSSCDVAVLCSDSHQFDVTCQYEHVCSVENNLGQCFPLDSGKELACRCGGEVPSSKADPYDNSRYITCLPGGLQIYVNCPTGQIFDTNTLTCVVALTTNSRPSVTPSGPTTSTSPTTNFSPSVTPSSPPTSTSTTNSIPSVTSSGTTTSTSTTTNSSPSKTPSSPSTSTSTTNSSPSVTPTSRSTSTSPAINSSPLVTPSVSLTSTSPTSNPHPSVTPSGPSTSTPASTNPSPSVTPSVSITSTSQTTSSKPSVTPSVSSTSSSVSTVPTSTTTTTASGGACTEGTYSPYPGNCKKYYSCVKGENLVLQCPGTLLFNPNTNLCDLQNNVKC